MRNLLVCFLILFTTTGHAAKPDWVKSYGYSEERPVHIYLVGFGSAWGHGTEPRQIAADDARAEVSRNIVTKVRSVIRTSESEMKGALSQQYSGVTQSETALQLLGLETEAYVDSGRNPTTYVLAYVRRAELKRIYTKQVSDLREAIRRILADAEAAENASKIDIAVERYLSTYPLYEALKEAELILLVAKHDSSPSEAAFAELAEATKGRVDVSDKRLMSQTEVSNRVEKLVSESLTSVDGIARAVVFQLSKQVSRPEGKVLLAPFTYQDTKMGSHFSRQLLAALEPQLGQLAKWETVTQVHHSHGTFRPRSTQHTRDLAKDAGATLLLSGTYWENGEQITIRATLRDVETGGVKAGAAVKFDQSIQAFNFKPQNYKQMLIEQNAFTEGEFVSGGLQVEVWTNKGSDHLLYTEGETMKVFVRVNRESYIRLLYILADGSRTLLHDNYYIDQSKVNRVVEIPEEFECAPPFGAELLVVVARTEPFPPIQTYESDGYYFLSAKDAGQAAREFRGMKKKQKRPDVQQSEARLVLTTMKK